MFHPAYLVPGVEITELICILKVVISAVFVVTFSGYSIRFTPIVIHTLIGSSFFDQKPTTICENVTMHTTGTLLQATKRIVFVPVFTLPKNPSASSPSYFDNPF